MKESMKLPNTDEYYPVLAVETSNEICSVAVLTKTNYSVNSIQQPNIHSEKLIIMIDEVIKSLSLKIEDIGLLCVSEGPGSFTGLRIGYAVIKGLALCRNIPVIQVPTFSAAALNISKYLLNDTKFYISSSASSDECFIAGFEFSSDHLIPLGELKIIKKNSLAEYSNVFSIDKKLKNVKKFDIDALMIAEWSVYNFDENLINDFDYIEPNYLKSFSIRG